VPQPHSYTRVFNSRLEEEDDDDEDEEEGGGWGRRREEEERGADKECAGAVQEADNADIILTIQEQQCYNSQPATTLLQK